MEKGNNTADAALQLVGVLKEILEADTKLRLSQKKALNEFLDREDTPEKGVFNLATGIGKTRLMAMMALAHRQVQPDSKIIVVVPNNRLIDQEQAYFQAYKNRQDRTRAERALSPLNIPEMTMGRYDKEDKDTDSQIIFTTYHSLEKLTDALDTNQVGMVLLDEAHHVVSDTRTQALQRFNKALHYGYTATPWYSAEKSAVTVLGEVIATVDIPDAVKEKDLAGFKNVLMVADTEVDLTGAVNGGGDFNEKKLYQALTKALGGQNTHSDSENWEEAHRKIAQSVAKFYRDYVDEDMGPLNGKKCLINCRSQEEARIQAEELNRLFGREVAKVHTTDHDDPQTLQRFKDGDLPIVCQVGKLSEGFDMPALAMTINYPTASRVREAQGAARCIRWNPNNHDKIGLVVDIAFKYPGCNSVIEAIHKNRQVLFQDVVGTPVCLDPDQEKKQKENGFKGGYIPRVPKIDLGDFTIVSNIKQLMHLSAEGKTAEAQHFIPDIRPGMLTSGGLKDEYGVDSRTAAKYLEKVFKGGETFIDADGQEKALVERVKTGGQPCHALHESPNACKKFEELYPDLIIPSIRPGMLTSVGLVKEYRVGLGTVRPYLDEAFKNKETFIDADGQEKALVERVKNGGQPCYALHESPNACKKFEELHPDLIIPPIRPGMLTSGGLKDEYGVDSRTAAKYLEKVFKGGETFIDADGQEKALVEWVKTGNNICHALHESPKARAKFEKLHPDLIIPPIRSGMLTSSGLAEKYGVSQMTVGPYLDEAFKNKEIFIDEDGKEKNLVERVKTGGQPCHALHESPNARAKFEELHPDLIIPPIRSGMLTPNGLAKEYGVARETGGSYLDEAFKNKETFIDADGQEKALVEWVKTGNNICHALHESPKARAKFEKLHPDLIIPPIRSGMLTSVGLKNEYRVSPRTVKPYLEEVFKNEETFIDEDGEEKNLVEWVKTGGNICHALHESPSARKKFEELHPELTVPLIRPGMLTSVGLKDEYGVSQMTVGPYLDEAFKNEETFIDEDGEEKKLVEWVKTGGKPCHALHESPKARLAFVSFVQKNFHKTLKRRPVKDPEQQAPITPPVVAIHPLVPPEKRAEQPGDTYPPQNGQEQG